jgi:hypothetical protein
MRLCPACEVTEARRAHLVRQVPLHCPCRQPRRSKPKAVKDERTSAVTADLVSELPRPWGSRISGAAPPPVCRLGMPPDDVSGKASRTPEDVCSGRRPCPGQEQGSSRGADAGTAHREAGRAKLPAAGPARAWQLVSHCRVAGRAAGPAPKGPDWRLSDPRRRRAAAYDAVLTVSRAPLRTIFSSLGTVLAVGTAVATIGLSQSAAAAVSSTFNSLLATEVVFVNSGSHAPVPPDLT